MFLSEDGKNLIIRHAHSDGRSLFNRRKEAAFHGNVASIAVIQETVGGDARVQSYSTQYQVPSAS